MKLLGRIRSSLTSCLAGRVLAEGKASVTTPKHDAVSATDQEDQALPDEAPQWSFGLEELPVALPENAQQGRKTDSGHPTPDLDTGRKDNQRAGYMVQPDQGSPFAQALSREEGHRSSSVDRRVPARCCDDSVDHPRTIDAVLGSAQTSAPVHDGSFSAERLSSPCAESAGCCECSTCRPAVGLRTQSKLISMASSLLHKHHDRDWSMRDFHLVRQVYKGGLSAVYQALDLKTLNNVALKIYDLEKLSELNRHQVFREIRIHSSITHIHVIALLAAFQEGSRIVLVQELAEGGDLYALLRKNGGRLTERQAVEMVLHPFLRALHHLHSQGVLHRDIKPENVLFTDTNILKLADFGLAIDLSDERAVTRAGTLEYMAPEVLRCPPKSRPEENKTNSALFYSNSIDAWAVGIFAYELIVGYPPFTANNERDSVRKIQMSKPLFPNRTSDLAKSFIRQALSKHPGDRPTIQEMLKHPWVQLYQRRRSLRHPEYAYALPLPKICLHESGSLDHKELMQPPHETGWRVFNQSPPEPFGQVFERGPELAKPRNGSCSGQLLDKGGSTSAIWENIDTA